MSFSLDAVRKYGPPLEQKVNELSKQLAKVQSENQEIETDDVVGFSDTDHSLVKYHDDLTFFKKFTTSLIGTTGPKLVFEPDYDKLTLWLRYNHLGWNLDDYSGFNNETEIFGEPCMTSGIDLGFYGGPKGSPAHKTDGLSTYYEVSDSDTIRINGLTIGISFFFRVKFRSFATQNGQSRVLTIKQDDDLAANAFFIRVDTSGKIQFFIKRAGIEYKTQTVGALSLNTVYDIICTYNITGNALKVYFNAVEQTYTTPSAAVFPPPDNFNMIINRRKSAEGYGDNDYLDTRIYREKVLTQTDVTNLYTNKISISTALFGEVAVADGCIMPRLPIVPSFDVDSFDPDSFTT